MSVSSLRAWLKKGAEVGEFKGASDWARMIADGNLFVTLFEKGPTGTLVGKDYHGNAYYEDNTTSYNRKRWVVYKDKINYNATTIPPEWHGWINYINDFPPTTYDYRKPIYQIEATLTKTGTAQAYQPKGAWNNPQKRNWIKYEAWKPPSA